MTEMKKLFFALAWAVVLYIGFSADAHAYLDPGTGSLLLQGLIATIAAGYATLAIYGKKIRDFFSKNKKLDDAHADEKESEIE